MRKSYINQAKLVVTVESDKQTGRINTISVFDNRTYNVIRSQSACVQLIRVLSGIRDELLVSFTIVSDECFSVLEQSL